MDNAGFRNGTSLKSHNQVSLPIKQNNMSSFCGHQYIHLYLFFPVLVHFH